MKAARLVAPKKFQFMDVAMPQPQDGQCLVKLERFSVCGSDIRSVYGRVLPEERYPLPLGSPCHELAGVVVDSRADSYREGQRVIVIPPAPDPGLVEYIVSAPSRMIPLPDEGSLDEWVMCQPAGTVFYACQKVGSVLGKDVLLLGQGSIGLCFTMLVSRMGARNIIGADLLDYRLEWAKALGATHTVNPAKDEMGEAVAEVTGGLGPDLVVEAAGYPDTVNLAFKLVRPFGTVILFGVLHRTVSVEHDLLMNKQPTIIPTTGGRTNDPTVHIKEIVHLRQRGWCDPGQLITHRMGFSKAQQAYDMYEQHEDGVIKVVMDING